MRKEALTVALVLAAAQPAWAQARQDVSNLSCESVQAILKAQGVATLQYRSRQNPSLVRYDRFVGSGGLCGVGRQTSMTTSIPVAGGKSCRVKKCVRTESD